MYDMGGRPWAWWNDVYAALAGGKQTMRFGGPAPAVEKIRYRSARRFIGGGFAPSICLHKGELVVVYRQPSDLFLARLTTDLRRSNSIERVTGPYRPSPREGNPLRLFSWRGELWAAACHADYSVQGTPAARVALLHFQGAVVDRVDVCPSNRYEKNWMPCVDGDRLRLVYSSDPILVLEHPDVDARKLPEVNGLLRGGSQVIPYRDGWMAIVHVVHDGGIYHHRFVLYDRKFTTVRVSRPFHFGELKAGTSEVVAGLVQVDGRYIVSLSVRDSEAWLVELDAGVVDSFVDSAAVSTT